MISTAGPLAQASEHTHAHLQQITAHHTGLAQRVVAEVGPTSSECLDRVHCHVQGRLLDEQRKALQAKNQLMSNM